MENSILKIAENLYIDDTNFTTRNFDGYIFKDVYFSRCSFINIIFTNCTFIRVYWDVCVFQDSYFFNNNILNAGFTKAMMTRCKFSDNSHNISFFTGIQENDVVKVRNVINPYGSCVNNIINPNLNLPIEIDLTCYDVISSNNSSDGIINKDFKIPTSLEISVDNDFTNMDLEMPMSLDFTGLGGNSFDSFEKKYKILL